MIQLATALPAIAVGPAKPNLAISAGASSFALALGELMPSAGAMPGGVAEEAGKPDGLLLLLPEGQELAARGKDLPDVVPGLEGKSNEEADSGADSDEDASPDEMPAPPFAWFATAPAPMPEAAIAERSAPGRDVVGAGLPAGSDPRRPGSPAIPDEAIVAAGAGAGEVPVAAGQAVPTGTEARLHLRASRKLDESPRLAEKVVRRGAPAVQDVPAAAAQAAGQRAAIAVAPPVSPAAAGTPRPEADQPVAVPDTDEPVSGPGAARSDPATGITETRLPIEAEAAPVRHELRQASAAAPVVRVDLERHLSPQRISIADIAQGQRDVAPPPAAAAQAVTQFELPQAFRQPAAHDPQGPEVVPLAGANGTQTLAAVTPAGQGQQAQLDTRHQQWTARMLDTIEALRGAAPVRETKLSLMPDALGKVDVSIRQEGDAIHVHFNTETQAARQLIADAQPKLAEIAEQRGIRLGSTSVESNPTGTGAGANPQAGQGKRQDAAPNRHPPSAPAGARREAQTSTHSDERIA